jgi:DNA-binding beta-propeller fold protein YncE
LAPHHTLVVECGNVNSLIYLNARTGDIIGPATPNVPVDELWFNPGDDLIYAANNDTNVLNVVDPQTHKVIQTLSDVSGRNEAAFAENNHVFTPVRAGTGDQCSKFGFVGTGCVAVFAHVEREGGER